MSYDGKRERSRISWVGKTEEFAMEDEEGRVVFRGREVWREGLECEMFRFSGNWAAMFWYDG